MRSDMTHPVDPAKLALRLRRFLIAWMSDVLGITILALCSAAGVLPMRSLWIVQGAGARPGRGGENPGLRCVASGARPAAGQDEACPLQAMKQFRGGALAGARRLSRRT